MKKSELFSRDMWKGIKRKKKKMRPREGEGGQNLTQALKSEDSSFVTKASKVSLIFGSKSDG
jgi:hypothetical protein